MEARQLSFWDNTAPRTYEGLTALAPSLRRLREDRLEAVGDRLSGDGRWVTLVAPPLGLQDGLPQRLGVDQGRILRVYPRRPENVARVVERALASPTVAVVLVWAERLDLAALTRVRRAAAKGGGEVVLVLPADR